MGDLSVVRLRPGIIVATDAGFAVNVNGSLPPASWPAGYIPTAGDAVQVLMVDGSAVVLGPSITTGSRPLTGTVQGAASSGTVPVTTAAGVLQCRYVGTAPTIGSLVRLDWQSTSPWIWPSTAAVIPPPAPDPDAPTPPAPPPIQATGTLTVTALDSGSWQVGGTWGWAGNRVIQSANPGSRENRGAWFYGNGAAQLAGATITGARIRLGARLRIGSYNNALPLHLYRHTDASRPAGDVTRAAGPADVTLGRDAGAQWVDIPASWGQDLIAGGGIAILGSPYAGITGVDADPASGQLQLDWSR